MVGSRKNDAHGKGPPVNHFIGMENHGFTIHNGIESPHVI